MSNSTTTADYDDEHSHVKSGLEDYEQSGEGKPPFVLTFTELKLLGIAGVGFFLDAYDLFIINPVGTMLQYRLYGGAALPTGLHGLLNAGANIGSVIGQFLFGYLADSLGRKAVYGKELMVIIVATILCISTPTGDLTPNGSLIYLSVFRILLGIGVGGDYPMSASVATDRANLRKRGTLLAYIFANQGWGSLVGSIVTIVVLAIYKHVMDVEGETSKVDGVWRIVIGLSLVPALGTLYQRLTLPESRRYRASRQRVAEIEGYNDDEEKNSLDDLVKKNNNAKVMQNPTSVNSRGSDSVYTAADGVAIEQIPGKMALGVAEPEKPIPPRELAKKKKAHFREFAIYFSEWRHMKTLIGTCACWFFLDIAFYGINLNQNVVLQEIGFGGTTGTPWEKLFNIGIGNLIITALGFVPGYYVSVLTIEWLGRKWIQIQGFLLAALFLAILAGKFYTLSTPAFVVCFAFLQFFFNFGANMTTYCYPAEVFPTRFRASAHGMSAAAGKTGAIISALAFNTLSAKIGTPAVLWIFFGCCIAGAGFTLLLPEVKGRDPDVIDEQEMREARMNKAN